MACVCGPRVSMGAVPTACRGANTSSGRVSTHCLSTTFSLLLSLPTQNPTTTTQPSTNSSGARAMTMAALPPPLLPKKAGFPDFDPDLRISVAGTRQQLHAHYDALKFFSSCVAGLPGPEPCGNGWSWDLRRLVLEGHNAPVGVDVVRMWLGIVYTRLGSTAAPGCWPTRLNEEARALLLFADAVGSCPSLMQEVAQRLVTPSAARPPTLFMDVDGRVHSLELLGGRTYYCDEGGRAMWFTTTDSGTERGPVTTLGAWPEGRKATATAALEGWLYLACRLELLPLARALMRFVQAQAALRTSASLLLFSSGSGSIFSARVLEHAPREVLVETLVQHHLLLGADAEEALAAAKLTKRAASAGKRIARCNRVLKDVRQQKQKQQKRKPITARPRDD